MTDEWAPALPPFPAHEAIGGRAIDVIVWGASRPDLLRRTIESFRARVRFSGRLRFFLEDGAFDLRAGLEALAVARDLDFDDVNLERVGSYGWAMTRAFARWLRAPLLFSLEDDWLCLRDIDLDAAFDAFEAIPHLNQLRYNRRENGLDHNGGAVRLVRREFDVAGVRRAFISSCHWYFNPALWRTAYFWPRWRGAKDNIHLFANAPGRLFLPDGSRPSADWYADTLGVLTWGDVGEGAYFDHIGGGDRSVHAAQGRV